jgi:hypothetical protein
VGFAIWQPYCFTVRISECSALPNETVEKAFLRELSAEREPLAGGYADIVPCPVSAERRESVDLGDIMNQREQAPLYIHFPFGAKGDRVRVWKAAFSLRTTNNKRLGPCNIRTAFYSRLSFWSFVPSPLDTAVHR